MILGKTIKLGWMEKEPDYKSLPAYQDLIIHRQNLATLIGLCLLMVIMMIYVISSNEMMSELASRLLTNFASFLGQAFSTKTNPTFTVASISDALPFFFGQG